MFSANYLDYTKKEMENKNVSSGVCDVKREYFKAEPDKYIDMVIIPYRASANNPLVKKRIIAQSEWVFSLDLFIHSRIGVEKKDYICPQTWGEKCPLCELQHQIFKASGKEAAASLRATRRSWFNIALCDQQGSRYGEMLVFNPSYYLFTEKLLDAALMKNRGVGILPFAAIEGGNVISCHTVQEVLGKNKYVDYSSFDFGQRATQLPQEYVRAAICFEDFLRMPDMNELQELASDSSSWQFQPNTVPNPATPQPSPYNTQPIPQPPPVPRDVAPPYVPVYSPTPVGQMQPVQQPIPQHQPQTYNPAPTPQDIMCPSGLRFGTDCNTQRQCNYCEVFNDCEKRKLAG